MRILVAALSAAALLSTGAMAQDELGKAVPSTSLAASNITDAVQFVQMAGISNQFEIQSSQLALEKSQDPKVREYAQMMITDHEAAGKKLSEVVGSMAQPVPVPTNIDASHAAIMDTLRGASDFDLQYWREQKKAHDTAVALFTSYSQNGDDEKLKAFAAETLPTLQHHQQMLPPDLPT